MSGGGRLVLALELSESTGTVCAETLTLLTEETTAPDGTSTSGPLLSGRQPLDGAPTARLALGGQLGAVGVVGQVRRAGRSGRCELSVWVALSELLLLPDQSLADE